MPDYPPLSTQVIGQAESALGALLGPLLAEPASRLASGWCSPSPRPAAPASTAASSSPGSLTPERSTARRPRTAPLLLPTPAGPPTTGSAARLSRSPPGCSTSRPRTLRPQAGSSASSPPAPTPCSAGRPPPPKQPDGRDSRTGHTPALAQGHPSPHAKPLPHVWPPYCTEDARNLPPGRLAPARLAHAHVSWSRSRSGSRL